MSATREGGLKSARKILESSPDHYSKIGKIGGSAPHTKPKGFAWMKENGQMDKLRAAGARGGRISRRAKKAE